MAKLIINIGAAPNDGTGDRPYTAGGKINSNFTELYSWARERVSANRTYYVATSGDDSHTGLSPGVALLTIQKAIEIIVDTLSIDEGAVVTIQVSTGTYTLSTGILLDEYTGAGTVQIMGNASTPGNVILQGAVNEIFLSASRRPYYINGFRLHGTGGAPVAFVAMAGYIQFGNIEFYTGLAGHLHAKNGGLIMALDDYTIISGATAHITAETQGAVNIDGVTVTLTGTPAFTFFAFSRSLGCITASAIFSGSATGQRYSVDSNSVINTNAGGSTFLPGNASGAATTGGQYV